MPPVTPNNTTYLFYDLVTQTKLFELPLYQVTFSQVLNAAGSFSGQLLMSDPGVKTQLTGYTLRNLAGRTALYVVTDGVIVWGGIVWTISYDSPSRVATIGGNDFYSYFSRRRLFSEFIQVDVEVMTALTNLLSEIQAVEGSAPIGVVTQGSGTPVNIYWYPSMAMEIDQAIQQMSDQEGAFGFDWCSEAFFDSGGNPAQQVTFSTPRRGRIAGQTGTVFDLNSGYVQGYTWPEDSTQQAITVYGVGAGTGTTSILGTGGALLSTVTNPAIIQAGWPVLEDAVLRSDILYQDILDEVTAAQQFVDQNPVTLPTLTVRMDCPDPVFGSYLIGDDVLLVCEPDEWFPSGLYEYWRVKSWDVTVPDEGVGKVKVTFMVPPLYN